MLDNLKHLTEGSPWTIKLYDSLESTNTTAKALAEDGLKEMTAIIADEQTGGRGRLGRSFVSKKGLGLYLTAILRPNCSASEIPFVTALAAVAVRRAIIEVCNVHPQIKWTNDLLLNDRKLCGILSELSADGQTGKVKYLVIGIGVNTGYCASDFPQEIRDISTSLKMNGAPSSRAPLAAAILNQISQFYSAGNFLVDFKSYKSEYEEKCITLGRKIRVVRGTSSRTGTAVSLDQDFGLIVDFDDGTRETVSSGEVSVRGIYGYSI